jgi:hypothetical protein
LRHAFEIDQQHGSSESVLNYATVLREDDRHAEALELLEQDLLHNPDPREHWLRSVLLLEAGRFVEGWREHEFRWMREPLVASRITTRRPVWDGQDLRGKTIVLHAEQGLGDAIQFIRYARLLKARGARVVFDAFKDFFEISHDFADIDEVRVACPTGDYDYHAPLLSLPRAFGTTVASIPAHVPYVRVRPAHKERWARRIADSAKLKVGLVWAGNPRHVRDRMRSLSLAQLACLAGIDGIQLYSLQKGATAAAELTASGLDIVDLAQDFVDFCDTAAAISHLDLVISVDTSVAHLAGALAKPVWLMIPKPADWRWLLEGDSTPWYPTMRIFRQPERGRWDILVEDIARSLEQAVQDREQALQCPRDDGSSGTTSASQAASYSEHEPGVHEAARCGVQEARYGIVQYPPNGLMAQSVRHYGEYRQAELDLLRRFIKPGSWVLEACCGAGAATLFLANAVTEAGHVVAYEDDQLLHQLARQNLAANRVRNVTLLRRRLGARPSPVLSDDVNANAGHADSVDGLRLAQLDWMMINASAAASAILAGASETLWRLRPWLFVVIEREGQAPEIARTARDCGYQAWQHTAPLFSPANYNCRSDNIFPGEHAHGLFCIPEEFDVDVNLDGCLPLRV